jgi:ornithine--oxo-acid transaminase
LRCRRTDGSTYGGNPLACAVAQAALEVIVNENLVEKAATMGEKMRVGLRELQSVGPDGGWISEVRGKGLLNAIVIDQSKSKRGRSAWDLCLVRISLVHLQLSQRTDLSDRFLSAFASNRS